MRCTAASNSSPRASSSAAIRSSYDAAEAHTGPAVCGRPIAVIACACDRSTDFSASISSTWRADGSVFAFDTFGLREGMLAEANAVSGGREVFECAAEDANGHDDIRDRTT